MNGRKKPAENTYDFYETADPLNPQENHNKCPYTGLPAAHLKIMNSTQAGLLTKIEKKLFFAQSKDFYAGILDKWILLYPSKSNDMKPSEYFYPKSIEMEKCDNQFNVLTNFGKRIHFQAPNVEECKNWISNILKIIEESSDKITLRDAPSQISLRKLPSPPLEDSQDSRPSSENYYGFNRSSNQTVINNEERLYEEPSNRSVNRYDENDYSGDSFDTPAGEITEKNEEKPPILPIKTGRKLTENEVHGYDVPKPTTKTEKALDDFVEKKSLSLSPSPEPSNNFESPERTRKVREISASLSINLVSPEEKRKSTHTPKLKKIAEMDKLNKHETEKSEKRISPMKNWFSKKIGRSKKRLSKREKTPEADDENDEMMMSVKGSKVNMIINQLEKNGQLKVLSKSLKNRKSSAFNDSEDYETVCVRN